MTFALYLIVSARVPEQHVEDEDAFLMIDTGVEDLPDDAAIPPEQMRFATTLMVRSDDVSALLEEAREHRLAHAGAPLEAELLTDDARLLSENSRRTLASSGRRAGATALPSWSIARVRRQPGTTRGSSSGTPRSPRPDRWLGFSRELFSSC